MGRREAFPLNAARHIPHRGGFSAAPILSGRPCDLYWLAAALVSGFRDDVDLEERRGAGDGEGGDARKGRYVGAHAGYRRLISAAPAAAPRHADAVARQI